MTAGSGRRRLGEFELRPDGPMIRDVVLGTPPPVGPARRRGGPGNFDDDPEVADAPPVRPQPLAGPLRLAGNPLPNEVPLTGAQEIPLLMEGGAMGGLREAEYQGQMYDIGALAKMGKVWSFNGIIGKPLQPITRIPKGRTAVINMINRTSWPHAMHLHGHHFRVVERNGAPVTGAPWRDTELVERDEQVRIAFVADNPGKWLFHCHMLEHQAAGMLTWLEVV